MRFFKFLFGTIAGASFAISATCFGFQATIPTLGWLFSGIISSSYCVYLAYNHDYMHREQISHKVMGISIALISIGIMPSYQFIEKLGAESKDSYHITFDTMLTTGPVLHGNIGTGFFTIITTINPPIAMPIQAVTYFTIDNITQSDQTIRSIQMSVSKRRSGPWIDLCPVTLEGRVLLWSANPTVSVLINHANFAEDTLIDKTISPGKPVSVWAAWECPGTCSALFYKVTVIDAAGETSSVKSSDPQSFPKGLAKGGYISTIGVGPDLTHVRYGLDPACR